MNNKNNNINNNEHIKPMSLVLATFIIAMILSVFSIYNFYQRQAVIKSAEAITNQSAEYVANTISGEIGYAVSSIKLVAVNVSQTMDSANLENPAEVIAPMVENTPFGAIEYIRPDGMNVMNIGVPFDASDRIYYIEGIKGKTGIWNNYHPKNSKETLMNFYTPLIYNGEVAGVITGYIEATSQIATLFNKPIYGNRVYGLLIDENDMVICSNQKNEYVQDLSLDMFLDSIDFTNYKKKRLHEILKHATSKAVSYKDADGQGRISVVTIPEKDWKVIFIVPDVVFNELISNNNRNSIIALAAISLILITYSAYILIKSRIRRRALSAEKNILQEENAEIRDIIATANMGTWRIEIVENQEPRMYVDDTMKMLLGTAGVDRSPEETYKDWFSNITPEALQSVLDSVSKMQQGYFDENTYLWKHPTKGIRYVRCGGTSHKIEGGCVLRGYHYDVDDVVREDQAKVVMLENALAEKNEYYSTLGTLGSIFFSLHVINLTDDTVVEYSSKLWVKDIVNHTEGATEMMVEVMKASTAAEYEELALSFTDLTTLADRMKGKKLMSAQFIGKHLGWFTAIFIAVETDLDGRPTKVLFTTRDISDEKKRLERLIRKTQTDELTGLYNRRAYEEDIYAHNDIPDEEEFNYISLDVNGLKVVNDTLGHVAGDELIIGACQCMKQSLGSYGKLYRTGGDEFVAILFNTGGKIKEILDDFDKTIANWSGKLVDHLTISYGLVTKDEMPELSVRQLGAVAEQRMYEAKEKHYRKAGFDRRGQQDAHKALCDLYTKILRINITNDTYQIINMDNEEQNADKGFSDSIFKWLKDFGTSGQVHQDDLEDYLKYTNPHYIREYFESGKTSLHIFYRRKMGDEFKQVMMELIPATDYTPENQSLFLYVKNIEK